jgi:hypothetical protein
VDYILIEKWRAYGQDHFIFMAVISGALAVVLTLSNYYYSKVGRVLHPLVIRMFLLSPTPRHQYQRTRARDSYS